MSLSKEIQKEAVEQATLTKDEKTVEPDITQQLKAYIEQEADTFYTDIV